MTRGSQMAGLTAMIAALLVPSWWLLPQVLAGLGAVSILSAGCIAWLDRAKPAFAMLAAVALAYQAWLVWRRPRRLRTRSMLLILWASVGTSGAVAVLTMFFTWRYRWCPAFCSQSRCSASRFR